MSDSIFHIFSNELFLDLTYTNTAMRNVILCILMDHLYVIIIFFTILFPAKEC